ncbi:MAG: L-serine ammonia-lyase, iron-sulfur-dependent, subunit alpha [Bacteroidetes bacterium]|nr:L-serine ammonia-lyase, iron-sulfur-dependent, subunit alpha [Bacteroidota bacterium]
MKKLPGIFNVVIGPVMRGSSSSHTAASWRIAKTCLDILNEPLKKAIIDFDKDGAWAPNFREQGTAMGIDGGLLGLEISDSRMKNTELVAKEMGITIDYEINSFPTKHANTVRLSLEGIRGNKVQVVAASLGGGSFEIQQINGFEVAIYGDYFELLIFCKKDEFILDEIKSILPESIVLSQTNNSNSELINVKLSKQFSVDVLNQLKRNFDLDEITVVKPVVPVISGNESEMPFSTVLSLLKYAEKENLDLGELGLIYEKSQSGLSEAELLDKMKMIVKIIEKSIKTGLQGTEYKDRILHQQSHLIKEAEKSKKILQDSVVNNIVANVTAIMESKSGMEVIVANPTAGSCGTVGGVLKAVADDLKSTSEEIVNAYFAAGIVGVFFAQGPGFSAEEHGCQVECGAASGMAAAGLSQLLGGSAKQSINAASMAIQNMIGLVCDPVADRVEVPCLGKNVSAAMNALSSATMACSGFDEVIPLDQVIQTVSRVSKQMPTCVKCTGKGGLAITPSSIQLKKDLKGKNF